jgi:hypothetical protein
VVLPLLIKPSSRIRAYPSARPCGRAEATRDARRGANRPCLTEALSAFVNRVQIPFFNTQMGKGSVTGGSGMGTAAQSERTMSIRRSTGPI